MLEMFNGLAKPKILSGEFPEEVRNKIAEGIDELQALGSREEDLLIYASPFYKALFYTIYCGPCTKSLLPINDKELDGLTEIFMGVKIDFNYPFSEVLLFDKKNGYFNNRLIKRWRIFQEPIITPTGPQLKFHFTPVEVNPVF